MKKKWQKNLETVIGVLLGNLLLAFTVVAFIVPHGIIMGGATGIGIVVSHYLPIQLSVAVFGINACLFVLGALTLGKKFVVTTIASTFLYPVCLSVMQAVPGLTSLTDNMMLATLYGGAVLGIGVGIIVRVGSSTGGTDILALVLNKFFHLNLAALLYVVDFLVLGAQMIFSGTEQIMYGILMLVIETFVMNRVMLMGQSQIQLLIISEKYEEIRVRMLKEQDVGVTMIHVETGYGKEEQKAVLCIIPKRKLYATNEMVHLIDEKAFLTISQINEVKGRGFTMEKLSYNEAKALEEQEAKSKE